eukprot:1282581-Pleurochrysis_carterae.AAC.1
MELARSSLVAASAPAAYWDFAVEHAVDVINRTSTPPGSSQTSYSTLTPNPNPNPNSNPNPNPNP